MGTAMTPTRRHFLAAAGACGLAAAAGRRADADGDAKVVLLGTKGGPRVNRGTANPSNLVIAGGRSYVVDCGYGVTRQLVNAGVEAHEVRTILITHNHSDHMLELGPLIYNAWAGGLREPIDVWGPPPLAKALPAFFDYIAFDIDTRMEDEGRPDPRKLVRMHEFEAQGPLFEAPGLRVSATRVRHPPITHAYAYRFDTPGRSIVLSGDTTYSPELIALAEGADVLVHEVMHLGGIDHLLARNPNAATLRSHLVASHTTTEQLGEVAAQARVKKLVLSHYVPGDDPSLTDAMWTEGVAKHYSGEIVLGRDLMTI
jgi:ribonuclease BN (tRNA processing enzyme)